MSSQPATKNLVILGAGIGGVPLAHHVLRFTAPKVPNLRVILVSPDTDFYWSLASPRGIVSEDFADKLFSPLAPAFEKYGDKVEIIYGRAESLEPEKNVVVVALNGGEGSRTVTYDTLVVATGAAARDHMPWKSLGSTEENKKALHELKHQIDAARSIVVAGGGSSGVEIAGELGDIAATDGTKQVTYVIDDAEPLGLPVKDSVRESVRSALEKQKVKIVANAKVTGSTKSADGKTILELTLKDGSKQSLTTDVYLPAFGVIPNTSFVPKALLDASGRIKQTTTLNAEGHKNIFVLGDVGNLEGDKAIAVDAQTHHLAKAFQTYLVSGGEPLEYKPSDKFMIGVSLGKNAGTGQMMGMKVFSFIIYYAKSRYMGLNYYQDIVTGVRTITGNLKA